MAKNKVKQQDTKLREDIASFKASMAFIIFCVIIFFTATQIQNDHNMYFKVRPYLDSHAWLLAIPFGIFAISAILKVRAIKKKKDESLKYFSTSDFLGLSALFVLYSVTFAATAYTLVYSLVVVGFAIGYYAKHFFNNDFYCVTLLNLAAAFALYLKFGTKLWTSKLSTVSNLFLMAVCIIVIALVMLFVISKMFIKKGDTAKLLDKAVYVFGIPGKNGSIAKLCLAPAWISLIIALALALILQFAPGMMQLLVAEIIILIQYVALGIFYTVKLINQ